MNLSLFQIIYYVSLLTIRGNSLPLMISGYLTSQNMNKYSSVIIRFSITINLKTKFIKQTGKLYLTVMTWIYVLRNFYISLLAFFWPCSKKEIIEKGEISHWQTMDWLLLTTFKARQRYFLYKILSSRKIKNSCGI